MDGTCSARMGGGSTVMAMMRVLRSWMVKNISSFSCASFRTATVSVSFSLWRRVMVAASFSFSKIMSALP